MKKHLKIMFPYLICAALVVLLWYKWDQPVKYINQNPIEATAEVVKKYEDSNGIKHTVISQQANTVTSADLNDPGKVPGFVDTVSMALKIALAELDQATKANFVIEQKYLSAVKIIDSLGYETFEYKGKYLHARYNPKKSKEFPNGYFDYRYNGDLTIADHTKETKFLGMTLSKHSYTDFFFSDTAAYLTNNIKRLTVEKAIKPKSFQLDAYSQYDVQNNTFGYGPSIRIEKGPIGVGLNQIYWPQSKSWSTLVNANFTIKSF